MRKQAFKTFNFFLTFLIIAVAFTFVQTQSAQAQTCSPASAFDGQRFDYDIDAFGNPEYIDAADFNNDGFQDLVVMNDPNDVLSILLNRGDGTFDPSYVIGNANDFVLDVGDVNSDNNQDLVTVDFSSDIVKLYIGNGLGGFTLQTIDVPNVYTVELGHANGDDFLDLALTVFNDDAPDELVVMLNDGFANFSAVPSVLFPDAERQGFSLSFGDFNGDGADDIVALSLYFSDGPGTLFLNDGAGSYSFASSLDIGEYAPYYPVVADLDGDENLDLIAAAFFTDTGSRGDYVLLYGNGDGTFEQDELFITASFISVAGFGVEDFNGDGFQDILGGGLPSKQLVYFPGNGDRTFQDEVLVGDMTPLVAQARVGVTKDFDNDGRVDFAAADFDNNVATVWMNMCGDLACPADFDGSGSLDVFDFLAFQNAWSTGQPEADLDGDGAYTLFDFIEFQNLFSAGC